MASYEFSYMGTFINIDQLQGNLGFHGEAYYGKEPLTATGNTGGSVAEALLDTILSLGKLNLEGDPVNYVDIGYKTVGIGIRFHPSALLNEHDDVPQPWFYYEAPELEGNDGQTNKIKLPTMAFHRAVDYLMTMGDGVENMESNKYNNKSLTDGLEQLQQVVSGHRHD